MVHRPLSTVAPASPHDSKESSRDAVNDNVGLRHRRFVAPIAFTITTIAVATVYMIQPVLPAIVQAIGVCSACARVTFSMASAFYAGAFFILRPLGDRVDRVLLARDALALLAGSVAFSAVGASFSMLLVDMALVVVSAAAVPATMFPYVANWPPRARSFVGYLGSVTSPTFTWTACRSGPSCEGCYQK